MTTRKHARQPFESGTTLGIIAVAILIAAAAVVAWKLGWLDYERGGQLARELRSLHDPVLAAVIFVAVWAVTGSIGFPALPLMIGGGVLFGAVAGTVLSLIGTALGATGGYWIARVAARGALGRWLERHVPVHDMSARRGFMAMVRFRLLPVVPVAVGNFAAGLAAMDYWPYLAGTIVGQLPSTAIYSYFADRIVRAAAAGSGSAASKDVMIASGVLLLASLAPRVLRRFSANG